MPGLKSKSVQGWDDGRTEALVEVEIRKLVELWDTPDLRQHRTPEILNDIRVALRHCLMRASELGGGQSRL